MAIQEAIEDRRGGGGGSFMDAVNGTPSWVNGTPSWVTGEHRKLWDTICKKNGREPTRDEWRRILEARR